MTVTLVKSTAGRLVKQQRTVEALGLKKLHQSVVVEDTPAMRGMIRTVCHLVTVTEA
ncbi:MAG: 50S ribosomal protein L30 [Clostridiales bacterium]|nr:50S ribosomal protein L30 [Clostridiales bacterium]